MLFGGETAESYYEEGLTASIKGEYDQALPFFKRALELDSRMAAAYQQTGKCLIRLGRFGEAVIALETALQKMGRIPSVLLDLGFTRYYLGDLERARSAFSEILQEDSADTRAILGLAYCAFSGSQWTTAINLVQHAMTLGRIHFDAHFLIARAAVKAGEEEIAAFHHKQALELMDHTLEITPEQVSGFYLRGLVHASMDNPAAALADMDSALAYAVPGKRYYAYNEHFTSLDMLVQKGLCLQHLGRYKEAVQTGTLILELAPGNETGAMLAALS